MLITIHILTRVSLFQMLYFSNRCVVYAVIKSSLIKTSVDKQRLWHQRGDATQ